MVKMTVEIEGMMCSSCERRVNEALGRLEGVDSVSSSHESGLTEITAASPLAEADLKQVIEDIGFTFVSVRSEPVQKKRCSLFGRK